MHSAPKRSRSYQPMLMRAGRGRRPICSLQRERPSCVSRVCPALAWNAPRSSKRGNCRIRKARWWGMAQGGERGDGLCATSGILGLATNTRTQAPTSASQNCAAGCLRRTPLTLLQPSQPPWIPHHHPTPFVNTAQCSQSQFSHLGSS